MNFTISVFILIWGFRKLFTYPKKKDKKDMQTISGGWMKQLTTGFIFALTCFTDPTYYAVMLMGGETENFLSAVVLLTLWFLVSQFLAVIVYIANEMNLLEKLVDFIKKSNKKIGKQPHIFFMVFSSLLRLFF